MRCTVLFFAQASEAVGQERMALDLPDGATLDCAINQLCSDHPPLQRIRPHLAVAVDEQFSPMTAPLHDGCTIALLPPVSGG